MIIAMANKAKQEYSLAFLCFIPLILIGCGGSDDDTISEPEITVSQLTTSDIERYAQCKEHVLAADGLSDSAVTTIYDFIPLTAEIHCADERSFELEDGQEVLLIYIAYGQLSDCPSGCFTSDLCAVIDDFGVHLFSATWHVSEERPLYIEEECPELINQDSGHTTTDCVSPPSGFKHPVTETLAFDTFYADEGTDAFRFCF